ncbi:transcriptional-regulating factor 1 isoform X1 [Syngnathus acus]|uniref:transcriptional-regulating factor 1 isoform X1 n=1 Tax=Syngnathus acus TaxID=161584 RepID=UPI0018864874|nr:transcriptional-regulating factor 1 isoform X1 [Syngnathus acus]
MYAVCSACVSFVLVPCDTVFVLIFVGVRKLSGDAQKRRQLCRDDGLREAVQDKIAENEDDPHKTRAPKTVKQTATMDDDFWSTQQFSNRHPHHPERPSFHLIPVMGSPPQDFPQQFGSQEKIHVTSFFSARRSTNAFEWLECGEKERSCDDAEAVFYSSPNWDVNSGQNFNPDLHKWSESCGELQNWDLGSSCETPSPLSEMPWPTQIGTRQVLPSLKSATQKPGPVLETFPLQPKQSIQESHWPIWGSGATKVEHFGSEKFFSPNTCSSAAPPFPFSQLESSMLSPPLTPLPPPSHSPATPCIQPHSQAGDDNGALHFFASNPQPLPSLNSFGVTWMFPAGSNGTAQGNLRSSYNIQEQLPSLGKSSINSRRDPNHALPSHATGSAAHYWKSQTYTGTPFPSLLHANVEKRDHYTPRPLLNPAREGTGLYSSFSSIQQREQGDHAIEAKINIGNDFQAELPPLRFGAGASKRTWEQSLWNPREKITENRKAQEQVEKLLLLSSSSCLPGGGSNVELALHSLHACQGDVMAALEMLLLTGTLPTEDYHYAGSDAWSESEKSTFNVALNTHGKNFSLIHKWVKTKTVNQCVEFYYLVNKSQAKLHKQTKLKICDEKGGKSEQHQRQIETPASLPTEAQPGLEEADAATPLAGSYPCTKCGKIFTKVKSRNAHMKIHRKSLKDWPNKIHLAPVVDSAANDFYHPCAYKVNPGYFALNDAGLPGASSYTGGPNTDVSAIVDADGSKQREQTAYASIFNQSWHSFEEFETQAYAP